MGEKLKSALPETTRIEKRKRDPNAAMDQETQEKLDKAPGYFETFLTKNGELEKIQDARDELLRKESKIVWDAEARRTATKAEKKASKIVYQIREDEREHLFGSVASEAIPGSETRDMGGQFLTNRARIRHSRIFEISRKAPKGAELHLHFNAELHPLELLERAGELDTMFIRSTKPLLKDDDFSQAEIVFSVLPKLESTNKVPDAFTPDYNPDVKQEQCWMLWSRFRERFCETEFCYKNNFKSTEEWIMKKLVLSEDEVYGKDQTVNG